MLVEPSVILNHFASFYNIVHYIHNNIKVKTGLLFFTNGNIGCFKEIQFVKLTEND